MSTLVDVFAQLDVILIALMLSGTIVQIGRGKGKVFWDSHYKGFYLLFAFFIVENIIITALADYFFLPFLKVMLPNSFFKVLSLTITLILTCCMWFIVTFGYRLDKHWIVIVAFVGSIIATLALFAYT